MIQHTTHFKLTRQKIYRIEKNCEIALQKGDCSGYKCGECLINKKFKEFVGIGFDELAEVDSL